MELEEIARRYHCTPVEALQLPAWVRRHVKLVRMGGG